MAYSAASFDEAFTDCIDRLNHGEWLEVCLQRYPQMAEELRPLLQAGLIVRRMEYPAQEAQAAQERVQERIAAAAAELPRSSARVLPFSRLQHTLAATALRVAMVTVVLAGVLGVGAYAAEAALPGDPLYGVKRFTENVRASGGDLETRKTFAARRIDEIKQLFASSRAAEVDFEGIVAAQAGTTWIIATVSDPIAIQVPSGTPGSEGVGPGDPVWVRAQTTPDRQIVAFDVDDDDEDGDDDRSPLITATATMTATPTHTSSPTPTASATPTQTPTSTATSSPTASPIASSTRPPLPPTTIPPTQPPNVQPAGGDDDDDNGGDEVGGDDDGDDDDGDDGDD
ncbi:MAG: hypothetical protein IPK19_12290 [Chloroflexi bacterium]|nr:hypothetical protein [Chloroflexota bacterium]